MMLLIYWFFGRVDPGDPESESIFSYMHTGIWMQQAQIIVGDTKTPIGIVLYSDKTHVLQGMQCYPLYCEYPDIFWYFQWKSNFNHVYWILTIFCIRLFSYSRQFGQRSQILECWMAIVCLASGAKQKGWQLQRENALGYPQEWSFSWYICLLCVKFQLSLTILIDFNIFWYFICSLYRNNHERSDWSLWRWLSCAMFGWIHPRYLPHCGSLAWG